MARLPSVFSAVTAVVVFECGLFIYGWHVLPEDGCAWVTQELGGAPTVRLESIEPGSPAALAGIHNGDWLLSVNGKPARVFFAWSTINDFRSSQTVRYEILRDGEHLVLPVTFASVWSSAPVFYPIYYFLIALVVWIGIFILLKQPDDPSARIFFVFSQVFALCLNSQLTIGDPAGTIRTALFAFTFPFLGTTLFHFFLLFPERSFLYRRHARITHILYGVTFVLALVLTGSFLRFDLHRSPEEARIFEWMMRPALGWMGLTLLSALALAVFNFVTTKEVIKHNQLRWVMIGVLFGLLPETVFGLFPDMLWTLEPYLPHIGPTVWLGSSLMLLMCLAFAIRRYRIWDIEIIIRKGLLYGTVSLLVVGVYLGLVQLLDIVFQTQTNIPRVLAVGLGALLFAPMREVVQRQIDRLFHREPYDPTQAAFEFEHRLTGLYDEHELFREMARQLDAIFHFTLLVIYRASGTISFRPVAVLGQAEGKTIDEFTPSAPVRSRLSNQQPIAVAESKGEFPAWTDIGAELLVPLRYGRELLGIFVCGPKRSERVFSFLDIQLLTLLAQRSAAVIRTTELYHSELERRMLLDRERERISKDMHDEVGASLTKIAILSEIVRTDLPNRSKSKEYVRTISETSREVIDSLSEIVWAINPKNDTLDNLTSYLREYAAKYFEMTPLQCHFDFPESISALPLSAQTRRNIFLTIKEALTNIAKHAQATEVTVRFRMDERRWEFHIIDNGRGFDTQAPSPFHNGLENMRKRIEEVGGSIVIESNPKTGTRIKIAFASL